MNEPIDFEHLDRSTFGDAALRAEVLTLFIEQLRAVLSVMSPSMDDASWRARAHLLKGAARGVGAFTLGDLCAAAEAQTGPDAGSRTRLFAALTAEAERATAAAKAGVA